MRTRTFNIIEKTEGYVYTYLVGETDEIKAIYKAICRHGNATNIQPMFVGFPEFSDTKSMYALCIDWDVNRDIDNPYRQSSDSDWLTVVNSDTMLSILMDTQRYYSVQVN